MAKPTGFGLASAVSAIVAVRGGLELAGMNAARQFLLCIPLPLPQPCIVPASPRAAGGCGNRRRHHGQLGVRHVWLRLVRAVHVPSTPCTHTAATSVGMPSNKLMPGCPIPCF